MAPREKEPVDVPPPPWATPARESKPRRQLSRDAIVEAALKVVDRDGVDALSMRRVAAELGTGAASLYWHVRNREELINLMIDDVARSIELPEPDPARWKEQLKDVGRSMRRSLLAHRDLARATMGRIPLGPDIFRLGEWVYGLMRDAGIPDRTVALTIDLFSLYIGAVAMEEADFRAPGADTTGDESIAMYRDYMKSLPPEAFPHTIELADLIVEGDPDDRFEFGLDVLIEGLAATSEK
jgi:AcrR family transcriptional regulator